MPNMNHPEFEYVEQPGAPNCWVRFPRGQAYRPDTVSDFMVPLFTRLAKARPAWEFVTFSVAGYGTYGVVQDGAVLGRIWGGRVWRGSNTNQAYFYTNSRVDKALKRRSEKITTKLPQAVKGILGSFYGETKDEWFSRVLNEGNAKAAGLGTKIFSSKNGAWYKIQPVLQTYLETNEIPGIDIEAYREASKAAAEYDVAAQMSKMLMLNFQGAWYAGKVYTTNAEPYPALYKPVISMSDGVRMRLALLKTMDPDVIHPEIGSKFGDLFVVFANEGEVVREEEKEEESETIQD